MSLLTVGVAVWVIATAAVMLAEVDVRRGGPFPLGLAPLISATVLLEPAPAAVVLAVACVVSGVRPGRRQVAAATAVGGAAAIGVEAALATVFPPAGDVRLLVHVVVVGSVLLVVDLARRRFPMRELASLEVTVLCAASLLAIAYRSNRSLAPVVLAPLLITRYSFDRLAQARRTYHQTTQALSLLPEVAGLTRLGHGERTAAYARALAEHLSLVPEAVERVTTAARLHHLGYISLHDPDERVGPADVGEVRQVGSELLRGTGFLAGVADLVAWAQDDGQPAPNLEAAIIRVCSSLDEIAEVTFAAAGGAGDPWSAVLNRHRHGLERTAAIALLALQDERPDLLAEARSASDELATAAAASASDHADHDHGGTGRSG